MAHDTTINGYYVNSSGAWQPPNSKLVIDPRVISDPTAYNVDYKTGIIQRYSRNGSNIFIPSVINGVKITKIGDNAFYNNTNLKSITIPDSIGIMTQFFVFEGCSSLTNINASDDIVSFVKATKDLKEPLNGKTISYHAGKITVK